MGWADFSRGRPRPFQWVLVDEKYVGIHTPRSTIETESVDGPCGKIVSTTMTKIVMPERAIKDEVFDVRIVDQGTGFFTVDEVAVPISRLTPLLDLNAIPLPRRRTLRSGFTLRP